MELHDLQRHRLRELLARLDRIATVSLGHRAGLHLEDRALLDQYISVLSVWENQLLHIRPAVVARNADPVSRERGGAT
ncbi:hypothetical protein [Lysobacter tyrosinilyticus]